LVCARKRASEQDTKLILKTCRFSLTAFSHNLNSIFKLLWRDTARDAFFIFPFKKAFYRQRRIHWGAFFTLSHLAKIRLDKMRQQRHDNT
jgi:hypothetical protein